MVAGVKVLCHMLESRRKEHEFNKKDITLTHYCLGKGMPASQYTRWNKLQ